MIAIPKEASTVILARDRQPDKGSTGLEVFLMRRRADLAFAAGTYVFPGGHLDPGDCLPIWEEICTGLTAERAKAILGGTATSAISLGHWVAGIRELFEEAGILLAYDRRQHLIDATRPGPLPAYRRQLLAGHTSLPEIVRLLGLTLATDQLFYFAHWITPETSPIRYSTRFFLARLPQDQEAAHDDGELVDSLWIGPQEALQRHEAGTLPLMFVTLTNLKILLTFSNVQELIDSTRGKVIPPIQPRVHIADGKQTIVLPGDPRY